MNIKFSEKIEKKIEICQKYNRFKGIIVNSLLVIVFLNLFYMFVRMKGWNKKISYAYLKV